MHRPGEVAAVMPAHNEAQTIGRIVTETIATISSVFVVDDGSSDATSDVAIKHGAIVISNATQKGYGFSLRKGLQHARRCGFRYVVTLDSDGVHDPSFVRPLIAEHLRCGADLTTGSRCMEQTANDSFPSPKVAANVFATLLVNHLLASHFTDVASGFRVLGPRVLDLELESDGYGVTFELLYRAYRQGLRTVEYPIRVRYDAGRLFCTGRQELLEFLRYWMRVDVPVGDTQGQIPLLVKAVEDYDVLRVRIGSRAMIGHPVTNEDGYVMQMQDPWFLENDQGFGTWHVVVR